MSKCKGAYENYRKSWAYFEGLHIYKSFRWDEKYAKILLLLVKCTFETHEKTRGGLDKTPSNKIENVDACLTTSLVELKHIDLRSSR